jgi:hypothetical protein
MLELTSFISVPAHLSPAVAGSRLPLSLPLPVPTAG